MTPYDSKTVSQFTSCCRSCRSCSIMWKREVRHFSAQLYWSCVHALGYMKFRMKKICFLANTQNKIGIDILTFLFSEIWKSKYDPRKHSTVYFIFSFFIFHFFIFHFFIFHFSFVLQLFKLHSHEDWSTNTSTLNLSSADKLPISATHFVFVIAIVARMESISPCFICAAFPERINEE